MIKFASPDQTTPKYVLKYIGPINFEKLNKINKKTPKENHAHV
jgi:hypothetical protein